MSKTLVVYYSKSGHTKRIAKEVAEQCGADIEAIQSSDDADKGFKFIRALFSTCRQKGTAIEPTIKDPNDYDVVVIGTPVWMYSLSSFTREYLKQHADHFNKVAFFCTEGKSGDAKVFEQMNKAAHQQPVATLVINEEELKEKNYLPKLTTFSNTLRPKEAAAS